MDACVGVRGRHRLHPLVFITFWEGLSLYGSAVQPGSGTPPGQVACSSAQPAWCSNSAPLKPQVPYLSSGPDTLGLALLSFILSLGPPAPIASLLVQPGARTLLLFPFAFLGNFRYYH